jgi:cytochrome c553
LLRFVSTAALVASALFISAAARPERSLLPDPDLFVSAGCAGCHGAAAAGAFGPTLAGTGLTFEAFLEQLRTPRGMMPPVAADLVSDEQARSLFDYVAALEVPEGGPIAGVACPCGHHGRGHSGGEAGDCPHHQGPAPATGQRRGQGGACRHGACARQGSATG